MGEILNNVSKGFMKNLCLLHFLLVFTHQNSDNDQYYNMISVSISMGDKLINKYFNILRARYIKESNTNISYSLFIDKWKSENPKFDSILDDSFCSILGCKFIDILIECKMLKKVIIQQSYKQKQNVLKVVEDKLIPKDHSYSLFNLPSKLPMIVKPKPYTKTSYGGYLLNDVKFKSSLFIPKKGYGVNSELKDDNIIYDLINHISSTPFKINTTLLNYLLNDNKHNLLIDRYKKHKFEDIEKRTKYQQSVYTSHVSKLILQETILGIAQFYSKFPEIYFPVRLDQRGRVYCDPHFLNYQSTELSKALLLFAKPGVINKNNLDSIIYLKGYGANCFGGKISKLSIKSKIEWVDKNINDIIDYDNGKLLSKAKDKLLFLSFCMEFKRFYEFMTNENINEFYTYLPIQLDATCNGFQHMALLSNEETLFKELNLVYDAKDQPKDFYNFLLHKLTTKFESMIDLNSKEDDKSKGSYLRLNNFIWDRSYIKKAIMTIPYNSSASSMKSYITKSLVLIEEDVKNKLNWYSDSESNTKVLINDRDVNLLIKTLKEIIENDFEKIKNLSKYLKNIANLCYSIGLPITWNLPTGLIVSQSYLESKSTSISPFMYSKTKLNIKVSIKGEYDKNKQIRALMPNLIHSLDATSLSLLYESFFNTHPNPQFFSIHDCFGTTTDKVFLLKTMLASVYTDLYSSEPYLYKFDKDIFDYIEDKTDYKVDRGNRIIKLAKGDYIIHDIDWVILKLHIFIIKVVN